MVIEECAMETIWYSLGELQLGHRLSTKVLCVNDVQLTYKHIHTEFVGDRLGATDTMALNYVVHTLTTC